MPLSKAVVRTALHRRSIICEGYERDDGLWDIEARMEDIKHYSFDNKFRGTVAPGVPLHEMYLRLTLDDDFVVQDIEAHMDHIPFDSCGDITVDYRKLIGVKIGIGWRRAINQRLGGKLGCTHLTELLPVMATVSFQTMMPIIIKRRREDARAQGKEADKNRPLLIDSCHSWASDNPVVKQYAPEFYTGE